MKPSMLSKIFVVVKDIHLFLSDLCASASLREIMTFITGTTP
jgi:hypothetical protein